MAALEGTDGEASLGALRALERRVAETASLLAGRRDVHRRRFLRWGVFACVLLALLGLGVRAALHENPWDSYQFKASSAYAGYPRTGTLGEAGERDLLVHTQEQYGPWILIDLGTARPVQAVAIENRRDCCRERGLPLILEVATEGGAFEEVARREREFDVWKPRVARETRYLRLRAPGKTTLHLREVRVR